MALGPPGTSMALGAGALGLGMGMGGMMNPVRGGALAALGAMGGAGAGAGGVAGAGRMMTAARMGTAAAAGGAGDGPRPMTSVRGAGFQSRPAGLLARGPGGGFDPLSQKAVGPAPPLAEKADNGPEDLAKDMERKVRAASRWAAAVASCCVGGCFVLGAEDPRVSSHGFEGAGHLTASIMFRCW